MEQHIFCALGELYLCEAVRLGRQMATKCFEVPVSVCNIVLLQHLTAAEFRSDAVHRGFGLTPPYE